DRHQNGRNKIESRWHRGAHSRQNRKSYSGRRSPHWLELQFEQRPPRALWHGSFGKNRVDRNPLAFWPNGNVRLAESRPDLAAKRRQRQTGPLIFATEVTGMSRSAAAGCLLQFLLPNSQLPTAGAR